MRREEFERIVGEELEARNLKFVGSFEFELNSDTVVEEPIYRYGVFEDYVTVDIKVRKKSEFVPVLNALFDTSNRCGVVSSWILWRGSRLCDYPVLESMSENKDYVTLHFKGNRGGSSISEEVYRNYLESGTYSNLDRLEDENEDRIRAGFERR